MGEYEVSREMITKYNSEYGTTNQLEITLGDMTSYGGNGANQPARGTSWNEIARFVNWLIYQPGPSGGLQFHDGWGERQHCSLDHRGGLATGWRKPIPS